MHPQQEVTSRSIYARFWDNYVERWPEIKQSLGGGHEWPGDEWGSGEPVFQELFVPAGVRSWRRAVEIGPGSGKYTLRVLTGSPAAVRAYDVSRKFLQVCEERCRAMTPEGRLSTHLLEAAWAGQMLTELTECGWRRSVDGFYSIDAMVHVDLQYLIVYLITAALVLRPGGKLLLTLADGTTDLGFQQMLDEIWFTFPGQANPIGTSKFEWLSPDLVRSVLARLGFEIDRFSNPKDIFLAATLTNPEAAEPMGQYILRQGST